MNRGRGATDRSYSSPSGRSSPSTGGRYSHPNRQKTDAYGSSSDGSVRGRGRKGNASPESFHSYSNPGHKSVCEYRVRKPEDETSHSKERQLDEKEVHIDKSVVEKGMDGSTLHHDLSLKINISPFPAESQPSVQFGDVNEPSQEQRAKSVESHLQAFEPFNICLPRTGGVPMLKPSLRDINRQKRNDAKRALEEQGIILEQGMVHLKGYLSVEDQVRIVKQCQRLGLGPGGFYQPAYCDGAKLHLKMMCLGKNWDPNTSQYGERRPYDGAKPPVIPVEFHQLVERAMESSRALVESLSTHIVDSNIPWMSPDICIVNFYSASGRLGLHQDKDESVGSLKDGLPVISFSIGDTGEFLYGGSRDEKDAKEVLLESGDVLIFGGKSRHIFHGVRSVTPNTAPKSLLQETNLRPGRLNLTFRQY